MRKITTRHQSDITFRARLRGCALLQVQTGSQLYKNMVDLVGWQMQIEMLISNGWMVENLKQAKINDFYWIGKKKLCFQFLGTLRESKLSEKRDGTETKRRNAANPSALQVSVAAAT